MAIILITDTPQGGACRCEGQAQALDLSKLKPEQVEALKQALGINANASQGAGAADFSALSPEQIEAFKQALGINDSQGAGQELEFSQQIAELKSNLETALAECRTLRSELNRVRDEGVAGANRLVIEIAGDLLYKGILDANKYDKYGLVAILPED